MRYHQAAHQGHQHAVLAQQISAKHNGVPEAYYWHLSQQVDANVCAMALLESRTASWKILCDYRTHENSLLYINSRHGKN